MIGPKPNSSSSAAKQPYRTFARTAVRAGRRALWPTAWNRLVHDDAPIFVGPYLGEVGFECLYWIPFLAQLRRRFSLDPRRFIIVTRGGAAVWYGPQAQAVELYDYMPLQDVRVALLDAFTANKSVKQTHLTAWEAAFLQTTALRLGIRRYHVLHPSLMYRRLKPWWSLQMTVHDVMRQLAFEPLTVPVAPLDLELPEPPYIAVKFYTRPTWPPTEALQTWTQDVVTKLATKANLVLLDAGLHTDDHGEIPIPTTHTVISLAGKLTPQNNLAIQSAVLANARAFVGTYGGTMQLAVRLGVPAAGFYEQFRDTAYAHKLLTEILGVQQRHPVWIGRPTDGSFIHQILP